MTDIAFRVIGVHYDREGHYYTLRIDPRGIDDPTDQRELLLVRKLDTRIQNRIGFFRDQEWLVQGTIKTGFLTLYKDDVEDRGAR